MSQTAVTTSVASIGIWAWSPGDERTNALIIASLFLFCLTRLSRQGEPAGPFYSASAPFFIVFILAPWIGGSKIAAEFTIIAMVSLACLVRHLVKRQREAGVMGLLAEQNQSAEARLLAVQTALAQMTSEANAADAARQTLLPGIDADMRGSLDALLRLTEMESQSTGDAAGYGQKAAEIRRHCLQIRDIMEDLADLDRIKTDTLCLKSGVLDLQDLLGQTAQDCTARLWDSQISLDVVSVPDLPQLLADERLVRRMIMNLVTNALRDTPPGGRIAITALRLPDGGLGLRVSSTGAGLSEADLNQLFEGLMQGRREVLAGEHQGLGLAVVKALVERHGGSLSLRMRLGSGMQATLSFPPERLISGRPLVRLIDAA